MLRNSFVSLSLAALAATASAQTCGTLTATGNGAPGTAVVLDLSGSTPLRPAALAVGSQLGTTSIQIGQLATLTLDIATPFMPVPLGVTDLNGDASLTIDVPAGILQGLDLHAQAVALDVTFGGGQPPALNFCVSNAVTFHIGP